MTTIRRHPSAPERNYISRRRPGYGETSHTKLKLANAALLRDFSIILFPVE